MSVLSLSELGSLTRLLLIGKVSRGPLVFFYVFVLIYHCVCLWASLNFVWQIILKKFTLVFISAILKGICRLGSSP